MPRRKKSKEHHEIWLVFAIVLGMMFGFCLALVVYAPTLSPGGSIIIGEETTGTPSQPAETVSIGAAARAQLLADMRYLWSQDTMWTRQYISAYAAGTGDYTEAFSRLQQNQDAIGSALASYYGSDAGAAFSSSSRERVGLLSDYLAAVKRDDKAQMVDVETRWHENSDALAQQLGALNASARSDNGIRPMLYAYQAGTATEIKFRIAKKWTDEAAAAVSVNEQALAIADALSNGILAQFSEQF